MKKKKNKQMQEVALLLNVAESCLCILHPIYSQAESEAVTETLYQTCYNWDHLVENRCRIEKSLEKLVPKDMQELVKGLVGQTTTLQVNPNKM